MDFVIPFNRTNLPRAREGRHKNLFLGALKEDVFERIAPYIEPIELKRGAVVCEVGDVLEYAYFPYRSVLSLTTVLSDGAAIETASIGREGAFGLLGAMYSRVSFTRCVIQSEGGLVRCPIELLQPEFENNRHVRDLFVSYSQTLMTQLQQSVACSARHTTQQRLCRWLLTMHDRAEEEILTYTHEALALILGANRKSVTLAAQSLQEAGFVSYHRGAIRILDRQGLENVSCECYEFVKARFRAFLKPRARTIHR